MDYGAIGSIYGSLASGLIGYQANEKTNQTNLAINRSTQEYQAEENQKQRDFTVGQWEREMAYNSPAQQMARYREAGLNPFLAGGKLGSGVTNAPSAPPSVSAPSPLPARAWSPPDFGQMFRDERLMASQSANQQAQSLRTYAEAGKLLTDLYGADTAAEILAPFIQGTLGVSIDGNAYSRRLNADTQRAEAEAELTSINRDLLSKYGEERTQREIWKLDKEFAEMTVRMGLYNTLSKVNESQVELNRASIHQVNASVRELLARSYLNMEHAGYFKQLGLTESQSRRWFVAKLRAEAGNQSLDLIDNYAEWLRNGDIRDYQSTDEAQEDALKNYLMDTSPTWKFTDKLLGTGSKAVQTVEPFVTRKSNVRSSTRSTSRSYVKSDSRSHSTSDSRVVHDNVPHNSYEQEVHGVTPQGRKKVERWRRYEK